MKVVNSRNNLKNKITRKTDKLNNLLANTPLSSSEVIRLSMEIDKLILLYFTYENKKQLIYKMKNL